MWRSQKCGQANLTPQPSTHWLSTWPHNLRPTKLQRIQKYHQVVIVSPSGFFLRRSLARLSDRAGSEGFGFHLQVHLGVPVGSLQRNMPEPVPNGVDVDPTAQQMAGSGMSNDMRADVFSLKRWHLFTGSIRYPFDESVAHWTTQDDSEIERGRGTRIISQHHSMKGHPPGRSLGRNLFDLLFMPS